MTWILRLSQIRGWHRDSVGLPGSILSRPHSPGTGSVPVLTARAEPPGRAQDRAPSQPSGWQPESLSPSRPGRLGLGPGPARCGRHGPSHLVT
jgi:hypothetical protein